jgi:4-hydroxy-tetrahydrodipicolinate synthase
VRTPPRRDSVLLEAVPGWVAAALQGLADSTSLPVMLYDIPRRTGTAIETDTLVRASEHDRIRAVKDAKG